MTSGRSEVERLRLFTDRVQRLVERRGLRDGTIASRFSLRASSSSTTFMFDIGDEDDLYATMTAFRVFTAPKEDTHFPAICNLLERVLTDPEMREANRHNRQAWINAERGEMQMQLPDHNLNERACYDLWVNAEVFHADSVKEALYRGLPAEAVGFVQTRASSFVMNGARIVHPQRNLVNAYLRSLGR